MMHTPARRATHLRAFTLIELIISMAITSVLLIGMASALMIATRSVDDGTTLAARTAAGAPALDEITAELRLALNVTELTSRSIEFTVPDRSNPADGTPETIRYSWSGTAGDPLFRRYNGSSAIVVAADVHHFDVTSVTRNVAGVTLATPTPDPASWGHDFITCPDERITDEILLVFHADALGGSLLEEYAGKHSGYRLIAQTFRPTLPANARSWIVTRAYLRMRTAGGTEAIDAQLREVGSDQDPMDTVLDLYTLDGTVLNNAFAWIPLPLPGAVALKPDAAAALVLHTEGPANKLSNAECIVEYESSGTPMTPDAHFALSTDTGGTWSLPDDDRDALFYVFGRVVTCGAPEWPEDYPLTAPNPPYIPPTVLEARIAADADDAEQASIDGTMILDSGQLDLGVDGLSDVAAMRFVDLAIPPGATILEAWVQYTADTDNEDPAALSIRGEATDDAAPFTTALNDITGRAMTIADVAWNPPEWDEGGDARAAQRTPELKSIVQEIVDRPGWASGNALVIVVTGTGLRRAEAYDGRPNSAPLLHVLCEIQP
ncbi:MAG: prepilin-type N-terminal cleavage/methylation domain-containing protein [Planctomycetes bacterium]|nr:prepilin-type N-terminal cleavage/methylation domain-containing protein [Planctomycetota bacterium]